MRIFAGFLLLVFTNSVFSEAPSCGEFLSRINQSLSGFEYNSISGCRDIDLPTRSPGGNYEPKRYRVALLERSYRCPSNNFEECRSVSTSNYIPNELRELAKVEVIAQNPSTPINFLNTSAQLGNWDGQNIAPFHLSTSIPRPINISYSGERFWTVGSRPNGSTDDYRPGGKSEKNFIRPLNERESEILITDETLFPKSSEEHTYFIYRRWSTWGCVYGGLPWPDPNSFECLVGITTKTNIQTLAAFELNSSPNPDPTPTATPTATPTPTVTPTRTPTPQSCLSEAEADSLVADLIRGVTAHCPTDQALIDAQNEIKKVDKKRCEVDKRKGLLHGLNMARRDKGSNPYDAPYTQNHTDRCDTGFLNVALFGRYNFQGTLPQKEELDSYLVENGWTCHNANVVTPYKFLTVLDNVALVVKRSVGNNKAGAYVVDRANDEAMVKFLEAHGEYKEFIKKLDQIIPRLKRNEIIFGVADVSSPNQYASFLNSLSNYRHGEAIKHTKVCLPPNERLERDEEECNDYSLDKKCVDELCKAYGLKKGMKGSKKDGITFSKEPKFRKKAMAAVVRAGFGLDVNRRAIPGINSREDQIIMHAILAGESKYNPWKYNGKGLDNSHGLSQYNTRGMQDRIDRVERVYKKPFASVIYYPKENLEIARWLYDGKLKLIKKNPRKYPISTRFNDWTVWTKRTYKLYLDRARIEHRKYLQWLRDNA